MVSESVAAQGFAPEPAQGALLTGLLELAATGGVPADRLAQRAAAGLADTVGDACVISLLAGARRTLEPIAVADADPAALELLTPVVGAPLAPGGRPALGPYVARFGLTGEVMVPMRARGRVVGELVALRRSRPFSPLDERLVQAVADVVALGLDERRQPLIPSVAPAPDKLSRREREVLALLALGHTNREIAEQVHLSIRTVEWHRARIQAKLRVTGRAALAQVARTHGLLGDTMTDYEE